MRSSAEAASALVPLLVCAQPNEAKIKNRAMSTVRPASCIQRISAFFPLKVFGPERQYTAFAGEANACLGKCNTAHSVSSGVQTWQLPGKIAFLIFVLISKFLNSSQNEFE
jgi:hypothetical protein